MRCTTGDRIEHYLKELGEPGVPELLWASRDGIHVHYMRLTVSVPFDLSGAINTTNLKDYVKVRLLAGYQQMREAVDRRIEELKADGA